ncbi:unnamed protein product [Arctogadus glacialis]
MAPWDPPESREHEDQAELKAIRETLDPEAETESPVLPGTPDQPDHPGPLGWEEARWVPVAPLAPPDLLAHKVSKVTPERLESLDQLDLPALVAPSDPQENQEAMVKLVNLARVVSVDLLDLREPVDSLELLDFLGLKDTEVTLVWMEPRERAVLPELRVRVDPLERTAPLDPWDPVVCPAREGVPEQPDLLRAGTQLSSTLCSGGLGLSSPPPCVQEGWDSALLHPVFRRAGTQLSSTLCSGGLGSQLSSTLCSGGLGLSSPPACVQEGGDSALLQTVFSLSDCWDVLVLLDLLVLPVSQDPLDPRERRAPQEPVELRALRGPAVRLAPQDPPDQLEPLATLVLMVFPGAKDLLAVLVLPEHQVSPDPVAPPDLRERQDPSGPRASLETPVSRDSRERLDPKESSAPWDPKVAQDLQEKRASEEPEESPALPDHSDPPEREEHLVTVVSQVKMVLLALRGLQGTAVCLGLQGPREAPGTPVAPESLVFPAPGVLLAVLVMLVPKAKLALLVPLVRTVAPAHPDPWGPEDSLESWGSQDPRELTVCLEKMERLEHLDPTALLDLLEREESKDSPDPPVSRVFPDLQAPQESQANLASRVLMERPEFLGLLDPEASVVSLERGVVLDPRVFRDPADFLVPPELMDPREPSGQLVLSEARDPPACRECPEREEQGASPVPRETEVTMERRDLRDLLARMVQGVKPDPLDHPVLVVHVALLVTAERLALQALLVSPDPLAQMVSLVSRERWVRVDRRERPVPLAPRGPLEPPDLMALPVCLDLKEHVVLRERPVLLVSPAPQDELDLLAPTVTLELPAPLVLPVKTVPRVFVGTVAPQDGRETLGSEEPLAPRERRESLARTELLVPMGLSDPRVLLEAVVSLVCRVSVEREASLDCLGLLESLGPLESLAERVTLEPTDPLAETDLWESRESVVTPAPSGPLELGALPVPPAPSDRWASRATAESLVLKDPPARPDPPEHEGWLVP